MKIILLSGGSGKRLWPLSNDQRSKQFIRILKDKNEKSESMVQRVWKQLGDVGLQQNTYIATGEGQRSILKSQLGISNEQIITEPSRRDTFPAIALASTYLKSVVGVNENETIVVLPVDPFVETDFFKLINELEQLLDKEKASLGLIGIQPTYPSEKYGYIVPLKENSHKVSRFTEKPSEEKAQKLINDGAVWNAGVFGFKLHTILDILRDKKVTIDYNQLSKNYEMLPKNSFDYEFVEKQDNIAFLRYKGFWKDLGTWNTLTEEMENNTIGLAEMIDSNNTHIINELQIPVAVIGLENIVVVAGPEGVLVSTKDASPRVKEINHKYFESIRFIEEDWGISHTLHESNNCRTIHYEMKNKQTVEFNLGSNEKIVRLSGIGTISKHENKYAVKGHDNFNFVIVTEG